MLAGSDLATSLSSPNSPTFAHASFADSVSGPITFDLSFPSALYQQYTVLPFLYRNHPFLAIGLLLLATRTANRHCTFRTRNVHQPPTPTGFFAHGAMAWSISLNL